MNKCLLFASVVLALFVLACGGTDRRAVLIYSPHGKEMLAAFEESFESANPDIDVQWLDMGSQDAYDRIRTEKANPQADLWWGAPSLMFERAAKEGLLEPYVPSWANAVPEEFRSSDAFWHGTFVTPEVIRYNSRVLSAEEVPRDWDDLLDPQWRDRIVIRYPLASGTMRIIFSAIIQREMSKNGSSDGGFEWLLALDANTKAYTADPTQLYLKIAREEGWLTLWNLPDVIIQRERNGYPFGYVIPESGTPLIIDGIAIVKGAKNPTEAKLFYEYVTSVSSMLRQAEEFYRIPARNDIDPDSLPQWLQIGQLKSMTVDWDLIAANERDWMKRWDEEVKGRGRD